MNEPRILSSPGPSKTSSTEAGTPCEETYLESLLSQVDEDNIEEIISNQKKSLERFEKTNEMLSTCCALAERRLEKARKEFAGNKDLILQAKADLESIFKRIRAFKHTLAQRYPEVYAQVETRHEEDRRRSMGAQSPTQ